MKYNTKTDSTEDCTSVHRCVCKLFNAATSVAEPVTKSIVRIITGKCTGISGLSLMTSAECEAYASADTRTGLTAFTELSPTDSLPSGCVFQVGLASANNNGWAYNPKPDSTKDCSLDIYPCACNTGIPIPTCTNTNGININPANCKCGTDTCDATKGRYCKDSTCSLHITCPHTKGFILNTENCICGTSTCTTTTGRRCRATDNTCFSHLFQTVVVATGPCDTILGRSYLTKSECAEFRGSKAGNADATAAGDDNPALPSGCYVPRIIRRN